jgi:hypothetical protein
VNGTEETWSKASPAQVNGRREGHQQADGRFDLIQYDICLYTFAVSTE